MLILLSFQDYLNSSKITFDVVVVEIHYLTKCFLPIIEKLKVPVIGVISHKSWLLGDYYINNVNHPADVPYEFIFGWKNTFHGRLQNTWCYIFDKYVRYFYIDPAEMRLHQTSVQQLGLDSEYRNIELDLVFFNSHNTILPRALNPNVVEIGGIHVPPAERLPEVRIHSKY